MARRDSDELGFDWNEMEHPGWLELRCGIARKSFSVIDIQFRGWLTDYEVEFGEVDPKNVRARCSPIIWPALARYLAAAGPIRSRIHPILPECLLFAMLTLRKRCE